MTNSQKAKFHAFDENGVLKRFWRVRDNIQPTDGLRIALRSTPDWAFDKLLELAGKKKVNSIELSSLVEFFEDRIVQIENLK
jgi:hypothetical protein